MCVFTLILRTGRPKLSTLKSSNTSSLIQNLLSLQSLLFAWLPFTQPSEPPAHWIRPGLIPALAAWSYHLPSMLICTAQASSKDQMNNDQRNTKTSLLSIQCAENCLSFFLLCLSLWISPLWFSKDGERIKVWFDIRKIIIVYIILS